MSDNYLEYEVTTGGNRGPFHTTVFVPAMNFTFDINTAEFARHYSEDALHGYIQSLIAIEIKTRANEPSRLPLGRHDRGYARSNLEAARRYLYTTEPPRWPTRNGIGAAPHQ